MYNPLPSRLTIQPSLISGLGLFATAGIAQGTNLGTTHIKVDGTIFRTPLGGFINCDENANCVKVEMRTEGSITDKWNLVTLRNITSGEELTLKYTFYKVTKDFLEEAEKEKKELEESYQESVRQTKERKDK
jgi:SET domain-containing protein